MLTSQLTASGPGRLISAEEFRRLADVPPELEWFNNIQNRNTRDAYRRDLEEFRKFLGIERAEDFRRVVRAHVIAWRKNLEHRKLATATIRRKLAAVSSMYAYLCDRNSVEHNPTSGVARPKEGANEGKTPAISDKQARALLDAPTGDSWQARRDRAMLSVLLFEGLRASELCGLRIKDYTERRGIRTFAVRGKGSKLRYLPAHPHAILALQEYLEASPHAADPEAPLFVPDPTRRAGLRTMNRNRVRDLLERYRVPAGLRRVPVRPHALRSTAATNALDHGADIAKVQVWLGHANLATTRLYDRRSDRPEESPTFRVAYG